MSLPGPESPANDPPGFVPRPVYCRQYGVAGLCEPRGSAEAIRGGSARVFDRLSKTPGKLRADIGIPPVVSEWLPLWPNSRLHSHIIAGEIAFVELGRTMMIQIEPGHIEIQDPLESSIGTKALISVCPGQHIWSLVASA